jgi:anti-sigma factor ChrR (cupin superfamily)
MSNKQAHPERELFEYLSGGLDASGAIMIEEHLRECAGCSEVVSLVRALRQGPAPPDDANAWLMSESEHPDIGELASLFYGDSSTSTVAKAAAHVALCPGCREEIAVYAQAEQVAARFDSRTSERASAPAAAWEMIREWEDSSFARTKLETKPLSPELAANDSTEQEQSKEPRATHLPNETADRKRDSHN